MPPQREKEAPYLDKEAAELVSSLSYEYRTHLMNRAEEIASENGDLNVGKKHVELAADEPYDRNKF